MITPNSFQVSIKNVGLIRKGHIEFFPGFTVIRGPSGSGKTTLIRAIEDTIYNTPGDSTVTFGEIEQAVRIIYNGTVVTRKRDLKSKDGKVVYKVNDDVFSKTGRAALDEVVKPLMMEELELLTDKVRLNFVNQFSVPFLVKESPSKIFEIVTSDSQSNLLDVLKAMRSDYDELNHTRKTNDALIDQLQAQINKDEETVSALSAVPDHLCQLVNLEPLNTGLLRITDLVKQSRDHSESGKCFVVRYKAAKVIAEDYAALEERFAKWGVRFIPLLDSLNIALFNLTSAKISLSRIEREIKALDPLKDPAQLINKVSGIAALVNRAECSHAQIAKCREKLNVTLPEPDMSAYQRLTELFLKLFEETTLVTNLCKRDEEQSTLLADIQYSLSEFKVCPLCNKPLE